MNPNIIRWGRVGESRKHMEVFDQNKDVNREQLKPLYLKDPPSQQTDEKGLVELGLGQK